MGESWALRLIVIAGSFVGGLSLGYYLSPSKIEEKVVEKTRVVREESKKVTNRYDITTGKIKETIVETGTKEVESHKKDKEKKVKNQKNFAFKVGITGGVKSSLTVPRVGGETRLPFFNVWLGAEIDLKKSPTFGPYLRLEF